MQTRNDEQGDDRCPISHDIIRYPVKIIPSEKIYEADCIYRHILTSGKMTCPLTRRPIEAFSYELALKGQLDAKYGETENRYPDYSILLTLSKIHAYNKLPCVVTFLSQGMPSLLSSLLSSASAATVIKYLFDAEDIVDHTLFSMLTISIMTFDYSVKTTTGKTSLQHIASLFKKLDLGLTEQQHEAILDLRI